MTSFNNGIKADTPEKADFYQKQLIFEIAPVLIEAGYVIEQYELGILIEGKPDIKATQDLAKQNLFDAINSARSILGSQMDEILVAALQGKVSL